ncbi:MAG: hypothetical protein VKJ02_13800 [Snowella sp.]|nr:hypothetical protein [Snowella sp.]
MSRWLFQFLSRDGIIAVIFFCDSLVVSLMAWLFKKMDDSPDS